MRFEAIRGSVLSEPHWFDFYRIVVFGVLQVLARRQFPQPNTLAVISLVSVLFFTWNFEYYCFLFGDGWLTLKVSELWLTIKQLLSIVELLNHFWVSTLSPDEIDVRTVSRVYDVPPESGLECVFDEYAVVSLANPCLVSSLRLWVMFDSVGPVNEKQKVVNWVGKSLLLFDGWLLLANHSYVFFQLFLHISIFCLLWHFEPRLLTAFVQHDTLFFRLPRVNWQTFDIQHVALLAIYSGDWVGVGPDHFLFFWL